MAQTIHLTGGRRTAAIVLAVLAVPLTFLSIFDPIEGGMALLATFALNRVIRLVSGVPTPRLYLWSFVAAVAVGGTALGLAIALGSEDPPSNLVMSLAYLYSAITLVVTAGAARYAWDIISEGRSGAAR